GWGRGRVAAGRSGACARARRRRPRRLLLGDDDPRALDRALHGPGDGAPLPPPAGAHGRTSTTPDFGPSLTDVTRVPLRSIVSPSGIVAVTPPVGFPSTRPRSHSRA